MEGTESIHRMLISFTGTASQIYPMSAIVLFAVITYAAASIINSIDQQMEASDELTYVNCNPLGIWKLRHLLFCNAVEAINNCFGWTLFLSTCFLIISFLSETFYILNLEIQTTLLEISYASTYVIQLALISCPSHELQVKVKITPQKLL